MVLTLPALRSFQHNCPPLRLGGGSGCVLPVRAQAGRTFEALANSVISKGCMGIKNPRIHCEYCFVFFEGM